MRYCTRDGHVYDIKDFELSEQDRFFQMIGMYRRASKWQEFKVLGENTKGPLYEIYHDLFLNLLVKHNRMRGQISDMILPEE